MRYIVSILAISLVIGGGILFWKSRENTSPRIQVEENISSASGQETNQSPKTQESHLVPTEDIVTEEYTVTYEDKNLYGQITAPRDYKNKKLPVVVISHGFNNTFDMYKGYIQLLAKQGFLVYGFDYYGGSRNSKSGGQDMLGMSVKTELTDLTNVVDKLTSENYVDKDHLNIMGVSQGGVVASLYAAANPEQIYKLGLIFPAYVLFDDVKETYQNLGSPSFYQLPDSLTHHNASLGKIYLTDALDIDIEDVQRKIMAPTLIVHGTNDTIAPYQYSVDAIQRISNAKLVTVEGGRHHIDENFSKIAIPAIQNFLAE